MLQNSIDAVLSKFGILASVNNKVKASLSTNVQYPATMSFGLKNKDGTYSDISIRLLSNDLNSW